MRPIFARLLAGSALLLPLALSAPVRAEDAPPDASKDAEKKDDKNIVSDLKLTKMSGSSKWRRERAEYWQKKSEESDWKPKYFFHLARHWQEAREWQKALENFQKFLEYKAPADDAKEAQNNATNRETTFHHLIDIYFRLQQYDKSAAAGRKYAEDYQASGALNEVWDQVGQAERAAGNDAKALEAFSKSAEMKHVRGYLDLVDMQMADGNVDGAKESVAKYADAVAEKGKDLVAWNRSLVEAIGTDIPPLDKAVVVYGENDAPKDWSRVTVFYRFGSQTNNADAKLENIQKLHLSYASQTVSVGIATYMKYNVDSRKVEADLPPEKEADGLKRLMSQTSRRIPPCVLVDAAYLEALHAKYDNEIVVVDTKGKLRYARSNEEKPYDYLAVERAVKKLIPDAK